jgi:ankyrin repeat protein
MRHPLLPLLAVPLTCPVACPSARSCPPFVAAARTGNLTRIEQLAAAGADLNVHAGVNNWTPLMHAVHKNQPGSVRLLLDHGARVNEPGSPPRTRTLTRSFGLLNKAGLR